MVADLCGNRRFRRPQSEWQFTTNESSGAAFAFSVSPEDVKHFKLEEESHDT